MWSRFRSNLSSPGALLGCESELSHRANCRDRDVHGGCYIAVVQPAIFVLQRIRRRLVPLSGGGGGHGVYTQRQPSSVREQPQRSNGGRNGSDGHLHTPLEATYQKKNDGWELLGAGSVHRTMNGKLELESSAEVPRHRIICVGGGQRTAVRTASAPSGYGMAMYCKN